MLQASYWVRPIYEELLYSSSHAHQGSAVETQRASNGLVKVISSKTGSVFFLLYAAWVRSRAERPSVSYTKVVMEVAWTGHNLQFTKTN